MFLAKELQGKMSNTQYLIGGVGNVSSSLVGNSKIFSQKRATGHTDHLKKKSINKL